MSKIKLVPAGLKETKLFAWNKVKFLNVFKLNRAAKAAVLMDKSGRPRLFLLDTSALLDILSTVDEALVDKLSTDEYNSKSVNPAGWLIDEIESKLPLNPEFTLSIEKALEESKKKGWIPFSKLQKELNLP